MHLTKNMDDGYLGSGKIIRRSIKKYGKENHIREVVKFFDSRPDLIKGEIDLITEEVLKDPLCMNLQLGGGGGFIDTEHQLKTSYAGGKGIREKLKSNLDLLEKFKKSNQHRSKFGGKSSNGFLNKTWSDSHREKVKEANKDKQKGILNSQSGTRWITDGVSNMKIKKESTVPDGWKFGRISK